MFQLINVVGLGVYKQRKWAGILALLGHSFGFIVLTVGISLLYPGFIPTEYKLGIAPFDYKSMVIGLMTVLIPMIIILSNWKVFK